MRKKLSKQPQRRSGDAVLLNGPARNSPYRDLAFGRAEACLKVVKEARAASAAIFAAPSDRPSREDQLWCVEAHARKREAFRSLATLPPTTLKGAAAMLESVLAGMSGFHRQDGRCIVTGPENLEAILGQLQRGLENMAIREDMASPNRPQ